MAFHAADALDFAADVLVDGVVAAAESCCCQQTCCCDKWKPVYAFCIHKDFLLLLNLLEIVFYRGGYFNVMPHHVFAVAPELVELRQEFV